MTNPTIAPERVDLTYVIRPLPSYEGKWLRYAEGEWLPDDGERDLAFIHTADGYGAPMCLYVDMPHWAGIQWSWMTQPRNRWHYMVRSINEGWGPRWERDKHPNEQAGRRGMNKLSSMRGCANGRPARFQPDDPYIKAGILWTSAGELVTPPEELVCMDCLNEDAGHKRNEHRALLNELRSDRDYYEAEIARLERKLDDARDSLEYQEQQLRQAAVHEAFKGVV